VLFRSTGPFAPSPEPILRSCELPPTILANCPKTSRLRSGVRTPSDFTGLASRPLIPPRFSDSQRAREKELEFLAPEAVKKLKAGGDREGEAPAEPHGARTCRGDRSPGLA